jgi:glutathione S-transferase
MLQLVIGNKNYSSWSLRAWLYLRESGIAFEELRVALFTDGFREELAKYTPAGRVPVLIDGDLHVWDSLAIVEHVRENHGGIGWPKDLAARAMARSIVAEMHSGFLAIRDELPQNLRLTRRLDLQRLSERCRREIARVQDIWTTARARYGAGGVWLFGEFSIADVFWAPVALRFASYEIPLEAESRAFVEDVQALQSVEAFVADAWQESERLAFIDDLVPVADTPLSPG